MPVSCRLAEVFVITDEPSGIRARTASRAASRPSTSVTPKPFASRAATVPARVWSSRSAVKALGGGSVVVMRTEWPPASGVAPVEALVAALVSLRRPVHLQGVHGCDGSVDAQP